MKICPTCQHIYQANFPRCPDDGARLIAQPTETEAQLAAGLSHRFRLVGRLGKGGFGTVFLAEQFGMITRLVALKVLNRKLLDEPDFLPRFQIEASSTGRIHHANVVTIYEAAQADDGTPYIAMEYLEGESLREALKQRGALPVTEVAEILQQTARGLTAAHKLGIIHRDLKPDNLFLTHGDEGELIVKVVDFGIAKLRESAMHTQTGMVLGTPAYMSYEQASGMRSDELDARSDIYSLGVVVYEMLTGRVPFQSDTTAGYLRMHREEKPPPFRSVAQGLDVPAQVEAVVMKALRKERDERYQSALEFAQAFVGAALPSPTEEASQPLATTKVVVSPPVPELGEGTQGLMTRQTKSAEDSVQLLREIERPWIEVTIEAPPLGPMQVEWVAIVFKNCGRTVAVVKEVIISKEHDITIQDMLGERGFRPVHSKDAEELAGEILLPPGGDLKRLLNLMPWKTHPGNYNAAPVLVWVWGTVRYSDAVTPYTTTEIREHVTNFCYACRFPVVHSQEELSRIQGNDDMRNRILRGFRKTGEWPLNKYS